MAEIFEDRRVYWVWLTVVLGAGNENFWRLCRAYRSISDFAESVRECRFSDMTEAQCTRARSFEFGDAKKLIDRCAEEGIDTIIFRDERYPTRLKRIPNPPPVLYSKGDIGRLNAGRVVSVVGTRTPCDYSVKAAKELCAGLSERGAVIVSGGEVGIDTAALEGVLNTGGMPVALLGRGILEEHARDGVLAENCILLSEFTDNSVYAKVSFNNRNRILCGLCDLVLFIEARADSKGLNNARHAERYSRPVFCVPPADIFDSRFLGQQKLLTSGAQPAFSAEQILNRCSELFGEPVRSVKFADVKTIKHKDEEKTEEQSVKKVKKVEESSSEGLHNSEKSAKIDMSSLTETQRVICELLQENGSLHLNRIAELTELSVGDVMSELTMLAIQGKVTELPGRIYRIGG